MSTSGSGPAGPGGPFPPHALRDYALLADGERGALIGPDGAIGWLCAPSWHDGAVLADLIGGRGVYAVTPREPYVPGGYYEEGTLVRRSRWVTVDGIVECREALAFPGDPHRLVLLRRLRAVDGPARLSVVLAPHADYGRAPLEPPRRTGRGVWELRTGGLRLRWQGPESAVPGADGLTAEVDLAEGEGLDLVLECSDVALPREAPRAQDLWRATEDAWRRAVPALDDTVAPGDARRAHAVLRGLTARGGGMVAAATTSLPERAEEGRNYDYRYVWIRDQSYAGQAAAAVGTHELLDDAVRFVAERLHEDGPRLAPAYTVHGAPVPDQQELRLPGYPGGFDRIGNHVRTQFQLDGFGEALLLFAAAARLGRLDDTGWKAAALAVRAVAERWREPDAGIWELANRRWTHSRLTCVAGLRALADAAPRHPMAGTCARLADTVLAATEASCVHPDGHWQRAPEDKKVDAALLLPAVRGALPPGDPRTRATLEACRRDLAEDHFLYRFRHDDRPLEDAEGAFLLCGFAMALAEHREGDPVAAYRWFERNRGACGASGLYAEEFDLAQRQLRGNLPQAFVHALLLETAARLNGPPGGAPDGGVRAGDRPSG
ncbi:glycoside hydrolase family 15 protein [Streptomyces griseoaurantiacus]|uniref:Glycoside hydrolase family 15 protein n=1 Tax=Streptomyces griseoaurantiacus TaxID=68213 RepID=A0ABZ1UZF2_9ACTN|nr:glycoside hydrolase family 15 protein [Streptomyces jietaisiensis]WTI30224.1 glycoside hydrolase family 15 protein [Streptomyces jietaisiensis]